MEGAARGGRAVDRDGNRHCAQRRRPLGGSDRHSVAAHPQPADARGPRRGRHVHDQHAHSGQRHVRPPRGGGQALGRVQPGPVQGADRVLAARRQQAAPRREAASASAGPAAAVPVRHPHPADRSSVRPHAGGDAPRAEDRHQGEAGTGRAPGDGQRAAGPRRIHHGPSSVRGARGRPGATGHRGAPLRRPRHRRLRRRLRRGHHR